MTKWITIAKHEYSSNICRKEFLFVTFGLPLLMFAIAVLPVLLAGTSHEEYRIGYVDKTGLFVSKNFTQYADEELAKKDLLGNNITHFFVIPADYTATGRIEIFSVNSRFTESGAVEENIKSLLLDNLLKGQKKEIMERVKNPVNSEYFTLDEQGESSEGGLFAFLLPIAFAALFMLSIFTSSNFLLQSVVEEKENRVMEILLSSVSYRELLIGKIFGLGAIGLTQILIWQIIGVALLSLNPSVSTAFLDKMHVSIPMLMFASSYFILGYLVFACIMAGVGAIATTSREGQQMAGVFSITAAVPLIIFQFITRNPDAVLTKALSYFPLTSPITMVMRLSFSQVQFYDVIISTVILAVSVLVVIELSVRVFRASLLMYGKKPTTIELIKYLRES